MSVYKSEVKGKGCISAKVVEYSVSETGQEIVTYELEYPRFIHGELMTHRVLSRNAMSSRAVPIEKMMEQVKNNPAMPIEWGINQKGMQAKEVYEKGTSKYRRAVSFWEDAAESAVREVEWLHKLGLHKQIVNRPLEPFQVMKTVVTATEWDNFYDLRTHEDAQPEFRELARCMKTAREVAFPTELKAGEWHLPYVENSSLGLDTALKVSASCCAQVSYRLLDDSVDKALMIYDKLVTSKPVHASPFEHQATPVVQSTEPEPMHTWFDQKGVTHVDRHSSPWSGNFKNWIQYRQLLTDV